MADTPAPVESDLASAPVSNEPLSLSQGDEAIAALLGDLDTDHAEPEGNESADEIETPAGEEPDEDVTIDPEDVEPIADENENGSQEDPEIVGGRFAPDTAKVTLEDGTVITVAELKRNNLFQRDYSKKTEEVAREREAITQKSNEISQVSKQLADEREFVLWFAEQNIPQPPQPPTVSSAVDPFAWNQYTEQKVIYDQMVGAWQQFKQSEMAEQNRTQSEAQAEREKFIQRERAAFEEKMPNLKDQAQKKQWFEKTYADASEAYGFTPEELSGIMDHRQLLVIKDALAYRRAKAKAPVVQQQIAAKPQMIQGSGKRQNPEAQQVRATQQVVKRLRETGSVQDADAAILRFLS